MIVYSETENLSCCFSFVGQIPALLKIPTFCLFVGHLVRSGGRLILPGSWQSSYNWTECAKPSPYFHAIIFNIFLIIIFILNIVEWWAGDQSGKINSSDSIIWEFARSDWMGLSGGDQTCQNNFPPDNIIFCVCVTKNWPNLFLGGYFGKWENDFGRSGHHPTIPSSPSARIAE